MPLMIILKLRIVDALFALTLVLAFFASSAMAQDQGQDRPLERPWFGIELPPGFEPHVSPVSLSEHGPSPARVPSAETSWQELQGLMD